MTDALLEVDDVRVHFGGVKAVDGVSLTLHDGMLYGLVGPNGSGKTTLLGALSRMINLTNGTLRLNGDRYEQLPAQRLACMGISRTFQTVRLLPSLSVLDNVMVGADSRIFGTGVIANWLLPWRTRTCERACRDAAAAAIERLALTSVIKRPVGVLPYGTQRRVEIARALAASPKLLLLDEPTAGMNREERDKIGEVMREMRADGIAQVLVEHDLQIISDICDHVFAMNFGKVIAEGDPSSVVQDPAVQEAYLGKRGGENGTP